VSTADVATAPAVTFHGLATRSGPLTWGQRWSWDIVRELVPRESRINLATGLLVEGSRTMDDVLAVLTDVVTRFETLRTVFSQGADGEPVQRVLGSGAVAVEVRDAGDEPPVDFATAFSKELSAWRFDLGNEPPVRFGVVTHEGRPAVIVVALSNMAVDGWSLGLLRRELLHRMNGEPDTGLAGSRDRGADWQPLDQAEYERTERARSIARIGAAYWRDQLDLIRATPPPRRRPAGETPRFWNAVFRSAALAQGAHACAARAAVPASAVLLSALAAVIGLRAGQDRLTISIPSNNRHSPRMRRSLGKFFQAAPVHLELAVPSFDALVTETATRLLRTARCSQFDPAEVGRLVHGDGAPGAPGAHLAVPVIFDYHSNPGKEPVGFRADAEQLRAAALGSELTWANAVDHENMQLFTQVQRFDTHARLFMWLDTQFLSRPDLAAVVFGLERLLVEAAQGEVAMAALPDVTGIEPAR
jgi:hypothetical protein